jgi:hypothetical protein
MTQPLPGAPGWALDQLALSFNEDWTDEWAHEYDVAEEFLDACGAESLQALLDDLDKPALYDRYRTHIRYNAWSFTDLAQVDAYLADVRACAEARLDGDRTARLLPPPGFPVRPQEQRPDVAHPELVHLAMYVDSDRRSIYFDEPDGPADPVGAATYRIRQLGQIYLTRLLAEIADVRATTSTRDERFEAIGGEPLWASEQDPDEWLALVEELVRARTDPWQRPS